MYACSRVLGEIAQGYANPEIARRLYLSEATVKTHVGRILAKLGLRDRVHVVIFAYDHGLAVRRRDHPAVGRRPSCAPTRYSGFTSTLGIPGSAYQQREIAVISTRTPGTHRPQPAEPNSDIKVQVRKGHRMFPASVIEPHTSMSAINSRSFRYVGVC